MDGSAAVCSVVQPAAGQAVAAEGLPDGNGKHAEGLCGGPEADLGVDGWDG
jgi:hypothetical protein